MATKIKPRYTDGFVLPVPKKNINAYRRMALAGGKIWMEHGALEFRECAADDLNIKGMVASFPKQMKLKRGETVFFSYITYKSRAHRDKVNAKVMKDPRLTESMVGKMPFDFKRMLYGGFKHIVSL